MSALPVLSVHHTAPFKDVNGDLFVLDYDVVPFTVVRLFFINAPRGATRGKHAHIACSQFMVAVRGMVNVRVEDHEGTKHEFRLGPGEAVNVPPMHWASQEFVSESASLLVLCDREYSEADYIREYEVYVAATTVKS